jgi:hypothetical protein
MEEWINKQGMNENELMLGNYYAIAENDGIKYKQITYLIPSAEEWFSDGDNISRAAKSVPLDQVWIKLLGFKWIGNPNKTDSLVITHFSKPNIEIIYSDKYGYNLRDINVKIKYVHQLQNLWFELTKFKLTKQF